MATRLKLLIDGDASGAKRALGEVEDGLDRAAGRMGRFQTGMQKAALPAAAVVAGLTAVGVSSADAASALEQSAGAVESVFGSYASAVEAQASQAATNVGLAKSQYQDLAAVLGAQLGNMGIAEEQLAGQTGQLIGIGADLAATFGGKTSDAVEALSSLMRGERDPIERYGVSIKAADVEARKAAMGLAGLEGEADNAATTQATLALLMEQTAKAQGAFSRESDTAAGAQQRANAAWTNAQAALGATLLPLLVTAAGALQALATWVQENSTLVLVLAGGLGALAAIVLTYNGVMAAASAIQGIATAAQWAWNAALSANPLGLIIIAIAAVIAGIVLLVQNWDTVKAVALAVWDAITSAIQTFLGWVAGAWQAFVDAHVEAWGVVSSAAGKVWDAITGFVQTFLGWVAGAWRAFVDAHVEAWGVISSAAGKVWEAITGFVQTFISWNQGAIAAVPDAIRGAFDKASGWVRDLIGRMTDTVSGFIDTIRQIPSRIRDALGRVQIPSWLRNLGGLLPFDLAGAAPTAYAALAPVLSFASAPTRILAAPVSTRTTAGGNTYITVEGALDPDAVARQLRAILNSDARRRGVVDLAGEVIR